MREDALETSVKTTSYKCCLSASKVSLHSVQGRDALGRTPQGGVLASVKGSRGGVDIAPTGCVSATPSLSRRNMGICARLYV